MPPQKSAVVRWYAKAVAFNVEDLFSRKRQPGPKRSVFVNQRLPEDYYDSKGKVKSEHYYTSNQVITSKYTLSPFYPETCWSNFVGSPTCMQASYWP
jgi:phospholipid-translocating ATPase